MAFIEVCRASAFSKHELQGSLDSLEAACTMSRALLLEGRLIFAEQCVTLALKLPTNETFKAKKLVEDVNAALVNRKDGVDESMVQPALWCAAQVLMGTRHGE